MALKKQRGLGRGLSALMADVAPVEPAASSPDRGTARRPDMLLPIDQIIPNPDQPRRRFEPGDLDDLANSIREKGVIQPLIVRPDPQDAKKFQIVAGERRWRASQMARLHELPVLLRDYDDTEVLEIAIIENIQRADLNPVEEAAGYRQLMEKFGHTQEKLAEALGKSRSHIANLMRLLNLPGDVQDLLQEGKLSSGHARALITSDNASELARKVVAKGLSVRDTEKLAKGPGPKRSAGAPRSRSTKDKDADTRALELDLSAATRLEISINHTPGTESGEVVIKYSTLDQLDQLCGKLSS
jgi:ParB family transcriptional regulator, chromosome partitioning protein